MYEEDTEILQVKLDHENKPYIWHDPVVEEFTKDDFVELWKDIKRKKPIQLPIAMFKIVQCDKCDFEGVVYIKQGFCPVCKDITHTVEEDANFKFSEMIETWMIEKNYIESIINQDMKKFVFDFNKSCLKKEKKADDDVFGEAIEVNE